MTQLSEPVQAEKSGNSAYMKPDQATDNTDGIHSPNSTCSQRTWLTPWEAGQDPLHRNDSGQGPQVAAEFSAARLASATTSVLQATASGSLADKVLAKQPHVLVKEHSSSNSVRYSPMRVALASAEDGCGSGSCKYVPGVLQDIVVQLLCAGANPNEQYGGPPPPLPTAAQRSDWKGAYALLLSGAKVDTGSNYGYFNCGEPRGYDDVGSALTAAVLAAYGAPLKAPGAKLECQPERPASWKPTDGDSYGCYALCAIRTNGLTGAEASELKDGRVSPSLAAKLELTGNRKVHHLSLQEVNNALGKIAATMKGCPKLFAG